MEENEKMEKDVNLNNNGSAENMDKKANNKGVTVVMIVIILVLILAIGTCIGFLFTGDTLKIINNKKEVVNEEEKGKIEENNNKSNGNDDKLQGQKSIFDEANNLKYTSNPKDNINGKIAVLKIGEKAFQTVMHDGYYTYTDNYSNSYNIKKITDITSEYIVTGNDNWANLFKCTVKYVDNNDKNKSFDIAVIVPTNSNDAYFMAPYENYTGSTSFVKGFTNLYSQKELEQMALDYYERKTGYRPGSVASELQEDGTVVIQLYDNLGTHNSTSDWYTVDSKSAQGTDSLGNKIDLN